MRWQIYRADRAGHQAEYTWMCSLASVEDYIDVAIKPNNNNLPHNQVAVENLVPLLTAMKNEVGIRKFVFRISTD